jgi:hypothetical protein
MRSSRSSSSAARNAAPISTSTAWCGAGEIHLSFTAGEGGRVTRSAVEQAGPFDSTMAQCIERAALTMNIAGQRGRSVYSYVLRFDLD